MWAWETLGEPQRTSWLEVEGNRTVLVSEPSQRSQNIRRIAGGQRQEHVESAKKPVGIHLELRYCLFQRKRDITKDLGGHCIHTHNPYRGHALRHWYSTTNNPFAHNPGTVHDPGRPGEAAAPGEL